MHDADDNTRRGLSWVWGLGLTVLLLAAIPVEFVITGGSTMVYAEGGLIENAQLVVWGLSMLAALVLARPGRDGPAGWHTVFLGVMAALALARELDLHEKLNPETLGSLGVRYRIDWVLDFDVPLWLKLMWVVIFGLIGAAVVIPVLKAGGLANLPAWSSARMRLLVGAGVFLALGMVFDDLLRYAISNQMVKQMCEESSELLGAGLYLSGVLAHRRLAQAEPSESVNRE